MNAPNDPFPKRWRPIPVPPSGPVSPQWPTQPPPPDNGPGTRRLPPVPPGQRPGDRGGEVRP